MVVKNTNVFTVCLFVQFLHNFEIFYRLNGFYTTWQTCIMKTFDTNKYGTKMNKKCVY